MKPLPTPRSFAPFRIGLLAPGPWPLAPHQRGFAILTVLGVVLIVLIYLTTVQGAIEQTAHQGRTTAREQAAADKLLTAVTLALTRDTVPATAEYSVSRRPLSAADPLWAAMTPLKPQPGDELLTVDLTAGPGASPIRTRLIVNRQGRRPSPVTLDRVK